MMRHMLAPHQQHSRICIFKGYFTRWSGACESVYIYKGLQSQGSV